MKETVRDDTVPFVSVVCLTGIEQQPVEQRVVVERED
jgi:hypothetical protein